MLIEMISFAGNTRYRKINRLNHPSIARAVEHDLCEKPNLANEFSPDRGSAYAVWRLLNRYHGGASDVTGRMRMVHLLLAPISKIAFRQRQVISAFAINVLS